MVHCATPTSPLSRNSSAWSCEQRSSVAFESITATSSTGNSNLNKALIHRQISTIDSFAFGFADAAQGFVSYFTPGACVHTNIEGSHGSYMFIPAFGPHVWSGVLPEIQAPPFSYYLSFFHPLSEYFPPQFRAHCTSRCSAPLKYGTRSNIIRPPAKFGAAATSTCPLSGTAEPLPPSACTG